MWVELLAGLVQFTAFGVLLGFVYRREHDAGEPG
jgi:hypothetical protein